jgi:hypothetical protein
MSACASLTAGEGTNPESVEAALSTLIREPESCPTGYAFPNLIAGCEVFSGLDATSERYIEIRAP